MKIESTNVDKLAIGLSLACAIHCLVIPLALVLLPTLSVSFLADESVHLWMLLAVVPTSVMALFLGCRRHGQNYILMFGIPGLMILAVTAIWGHEWFGESGEKVISFFGAGLIALAHFNNHRLCRLTQCKCDPS